MSVGAIGPDPGFFTSPSTLPAGLAGGSAVGPTGGAASSTPSGSAVSSYQTAYNNLTIQDNIELIQVSTASPDAAASNVSNVLAQAAKLQQQELAAQQAAQASAGNAPITAPAIPSLTSMKQQSDSLAASDLANGTIGALVDTSA